MNTEHERPRTLREIELEVMAEGREWTRKRLQQRLQEEADLHGGVFPQSQSRVVHRRSRPRIGCLRPSNTFAKVAP